MEAGEDLCPGCGWKISLPGGDTGFSWESGCGKTTVGRLILKLIEPTEGEILFEGKNLTRLDKKQIHPMRRAFQIIFQDPFASLNPRMTVSETVGRPMEIHGLAKVSEG